MPQAPDFSQLLQAVNNKTLPQPADYKRWVEASDRVSIHAKGIRPRFVSPRANSKGEYTGATYTVTPANYESRYQYLFDDYILNRHPNESWESYNWRLSTFPIIAQEIYLNAKNQILGAIFQTSHYTIKANNEKDQAYLDSIEFSDLLTEDIPDFIFTDPHGLIAIVETHNTPFDSTESAAPGVELVESRHIKYYEEDTAILFKSSKQLKGKNLLYYIDTTWCVKLIETEKDKYTVLSYYAHGFEELPVIENCSNFFQAYVSWADMLARNLSDDEMIAKNASYPIREIITSVCTTCMGGKKIPDPEKGPGNFLPCPECGGKGVHSINPGEDIMTPEPDKNDNRPQIDRVKHYNPDISINQFSFDRWQKIYDFGMRSMHLKFVEQAQSGEAKAIDREQLYYLLVNVTTKLFGIAEKAMRYILGYLNVTNVDGVIKHDFKAYTIDPPTQFQIKTETDLQGEYTALITGQADLMARRQKLDEYMKKVCFGDNVALKKWEIVKRWDWLYGMNDEELNTRKLLGSAGTNDFIRHDHIDSLLSEITMDKGDQWLTDADYRTIMKELDALVAPYLVAGPIAIPAA